MALCLPNLTLFEKRRIKKGSTFFAKHTLHDSWTTTHARPALALPVRWPPPHATRQPNQTPPVRLQLSSAPPLPFFSLSLSLHDNCLAMLCFPLLHASLFLVTSARSPPHSPSSPCFRLTGPFSFFFFHFFFLHHLSPFLLYSYAVWLMGTPTKRIHSPSRLPNYSYPPPSEEDSTAGFLLLWLFNLPLSSSPCRLFHFFSLYPRSWPFSSCSDT